MTLKFNKKSIELILFITDNNINNDSKFISYLTELIMRNINSNYNNYHDHMPVSFIIDYIILDDKYSYELMDEVKKKNYYRS